MKIELPTHGKIPTILERSVETGVEFVDCLGLDQTLTEQPHHLRIRHGYVKAQTQDLLEQQAVLDLENSVPSSGVRDVRSAQRIERLMHLCLLVVISPNVPVENSPV